MILVIGGAFNGKSEFVKNELRIDDRKVLYNFHTKIKEVIKNGDSIDSFINNIFADDISVIISDEINCGIVPLDRWDRHWREECGRALCKIAAKCNEVWRIQCGIPIKIKG